ncbi:Putative uncharacterized protein [Moritella viscosa]|uniref:Uncharacterized protein n=1 Tax=Moritella viscosa TaxID=80854 RepID=A0ABY1HGZ4_9GAMM|nr:Putative uncharacterized protein [Moritella viscosa]SGZ05052.1 Putative uncharacterized protein [Moritella viscosa]SGZ05319.1 Putative uncharacterized protein [Moritella viscosa]SGZ12183.1 Putative uncharacterized protein [Moritella viscosa]SHO27671.1 Putative uncharacterized protein [Moritella viscosa]
MILGGDNLFMPTWLLYLTMRMSPIPATDHIEQKVDAYKQFKTA